MCYENRKKAPGGRRFLIGHNCKGGDLHSYHFDNHSMGGVNDYLSLKSLLGERELGSEKVFTIIEGLKYKILWERIIRREYEK